MSALEEGNGGGYRRASIEQMIWQGFENPRTQASYASALGWDATQISRFKAGLQGVPIGKLDTLFRMLGVVPVTPKYLDALAGLATVGSACDCARKGGGVCGAVWIGE